MTRPKPATRKAKMGRKSRRLKRNQDNLLSMIVFTKGMTPWEASLIVGCGYEYAVKKFHEFHDESKSWHTTNYHPDFRS